VTGLPTLLVELDDGTGAFPFNITRYVDLKGDQWRLERGRQDEFDDIEAGRLTLRLNNNDGRFTLGAPAYNIVVDQRLRLTETVGATVSRRFTGYVQDWPTRWPDPVARQSYTSITVMDRLARLARRDVPEDLYVGDISGPDLSVHYALTEPEDSVSAGDTSGRARPTLTIVGSGSSIGFGVDDTPSLGTSVEVTQVGPAAIGQQGEYLGLSTQTQLVPPASNFGIELLFKKTSGLDVYGGALFQINFEGLATTQGPGTNPRAFIRALWDNSTDNLIVGADGPFGSDPAPSKTGLTDGHWHHLAVYVVAGHLRVYFDGVRTGPTPAFSINVGMNMLYVGGSGADVAPVSALIQHFVILTGGLDGAVDAATCDAVVAAHASAALDVTVDSSTERIARLAGLGLIPPAEQALEAGVLQSTAYTSGGDSQVLDAMQATALAEGGTVFADGTGRLVFQNRDHRPLAVAQPPVLTLQAGDYEDDDLTVSVDKQYLKNTATGTRPDGATQTASDAVSLAQYEEYGESVTLLVTTDQEVLDRLNWIVARYSQPLPRLSSLTIDLLTQPAAFQAAALSLEIGSKVLIGGLPTQSPVASIAAIVEGSVETQGVDRWTLTLNTVSAALYQAWVLEDPTYGVLGATTRLYF
jgi:hypothetical protein